MTTRPGSSGPVERAGAFYNSGSQWVRTVDQPVSVDQLAFPATQDASADANTLDDYEEGEFTPGIGDNNFDGSGEGQTYSAQVGLYTKIGNMVFWSLDMTISSLGTLTTTHQGRITGLPFTSNSTAARKWGGSVGFASGLAITAGTSVQATMDNNVSHLNLQNWDVTTGSSALLISEITADARFIAFGHYQV